MLVFHNLCVLEWWEAKSPDAKDGFLLSVFVLSLGKNMWFRVRIHKIPDTDISLIKNHQEEMTWDVH